MIKNVNRYDAYAYRIASRPFAPLAGNIHEGSWITLNDDGQIVQSTGAKKSFLLLTSKRPGRDNVSPQQFPRGSYLLGAFEITVVNDADADTAFDSTETYAAMTPLKVNADGILTPWVAPTIATGSITAAGDIGVEIAAYALGAPVDNELRICSK